MNYLITFNSKIKQNGAFKKYFGKLNVRLSIELCYVKYVTHISKDLALLSLAASSLSRFKRHLTILDFGSLPLFMKHA